MEIDDWQAKHDAENKDCRTSVGLHASSRSDFDFVIRRTGGSGLLHTQIDCFNIIDRPAYD